MHLKRQKIPKNWPIPRKGTAYVVRPNFNIKNGIPILIIIRDILKLAQNKKEVKKAIHSKNILINNKIVRDEKNSALLFDIISIPPLKKHYKVELSEKGKFQAKEIKETESINKISKIINKKTLKGKKTQLNLSDGKNFISDIKCNVNDSVLINLKSKKIEKCLPLKEKAKVIVIGGKHIGEIGIINNINIERKITELTIEKKPVNVLIKQLMVTE
ncbi:30S ribosomal protein S4e [Candidatus Pacearchaeota archaeon]|jgi:small subunit ribosomal protein S4e|nr:30S ribosomal protein S4e [Candidatus Pacearchaeota archaeon]|tara:strand:- start:6413 stop:7060 length:648 start_codon:yes stop_codon:yes gene_type:complete